MMSWARCARQLAGATLALALSVSLGSPPASAVDTPTVPPARVHGYYHITWNGLDLGEFVWDSTISGGQYKVSTNANISALLGAYTWQGVTRANGTYAPGSPHPASYRFRFDATDKAGRIDMTFANDSVTQVSENPPDRGTSGRVPLRPAHLQNVLDPLSAIMALSAPEGGSVDNSNPCQRRLPVFDGKIRFDLVLSFKRKTQLEGSGARFAYVCRVQFVPIAGHKMNNETKYMAQNDGIELWMAPVAFANVFVPYNVVIPTWAGSAQITSSRVQIDMPGRGRVALSLN